MLKSRPEYFASPDSREQWMTTLDNKIKESKEILTHIVQNESDKTKKIERLESQINILEDEKKNFQQEVNSLKEQNQELTQANQKLQARVEELEKIIVSAREQLNQIQIGEQVAQIQYSPPFSKK